MTLRESLYQICKVEKNKYLLETFKTKVSERLNQLTQEKKEIEEIYNAHNKNQPSFVPEPSELPMFVFYCVALIIFILSMLNGNKGEIPIAIICGIIYIILLKDKKEKEKEREKYLLAMKAYTKKKQEYEYEIRVYKCEISKVNAIKTDLIKAIVNVDMELTHLYIKSNIYPKYRNFVAMSTIYEYIAAGICTRLEGNDGAYKFYEEQAMRGYIVSSIKQAVKENLSKQRFLEQSLYESRQEVAKMESRLNSVNKNYDVLMKQMKKLSSPRK